jgi:outer membrane protein assembly factor BamE
MAAARIWALHHIDAPWRTLPAMPMSRFSLRCASGLAALLALGGCASLQTSDNLLARITPYHVEVVQGNVVTKEQMARVSPGLTRAQVRDIMGSPLLTDPFHADRWDYVFTIRRQGTAPQQRTIVLHFDGDKLKSAEAPELPSEREFVASIDTFSGKREAPPLALTDEQRQALPIPPKPAPEPAEPSGPARSYPPLEPRT